MENYSGVEDVGWDAVDVGLRTLNSDHFTSRSMLSTIKIVT